MTLPAETSDRLQRLLAAMLDERLSDEQVDDLRLLLRDNPAARRQYVRHAITHAMLQWISGPPGIELGKGRLEKDGSGIGDRETENDALPAVVATSSPVLGFLGNATHGTVGYFSSGWPLAYLVATAIFGAALLVGSLVPVSSPQQIARQSVPLPFPLSPLPSIVGRITGMVECKWVQGPGSRVQSPALDSRLSTLVSLGDTFALTSGLMEITYDTGAKVILQGPVTYEVESAAGGFLSVGKLTARLEKKVASGQWLVASTSEIRNQKSEISNPQSLIPNPSSLSTIHYPLFTIKTPTALITDLGTEFGVEVTRNQRCQLKVFQGRVVLQTRKSVGAALQTIELGPDEAASVQPSGAVNRYEGSVAEASAMAVTFARKLPRRGDRTSGGLSQTPNPIDSTPGLLYHLDAAIGVTVNEQGHVRLWADRNRSNNTFVRSWESELVAIPDDPAFNNHPVVRNTTTHIAGLCLRQETSPRSVIAVQRTIQSLGNGGLWGYAERNEAWHDCGIRRDFYHPTGGWSASRGNSDDLAYHGKFYINGFENELQPFNTPGILEAYGPSPKYSTFPSTTIFGYTDLHNGERWWQGDIAELIAFDRILTQTERASIVGYLGAKYRIATPFDSYKSELSSSSSSKTTPAMSTRKEKTP